MLNEWKRLWQAKKWMQKNETFLETWHAHIGHALHLFDYFEKSAKPEDVVESYHLDSVLLSRWIEVGLSLGHLEKKRGGKIKTEASIHKYLSKESPDSVGVILKEMMELHVPTLLAYKDLMRGYDKVTYLEKDYGKTVAETSALLETLAFPKVMKIIKKRKIKSIIDIGCGYAGYLRRIHEQKPDIRLTGVEMHSELYETAKNRCEGTSITLHHENFDNYVHMKARQDMVMMNNLLYYFSPGKRQDVFDHATRILAKKGTLLIMSPLHDSKHGKAFSTAFNSFMSAHENLHPLPSEKEIRAIGKLSGLKLVSVEPVLKEGGWYLLELQKKE